MWAEDKEAYRKIFDYHSGNPDQEQTDNLRLGIPRSRPRNFLGLAWEIWNLKFDYQISQARPRNSQSEIMGLLSAWEFLGLFLGLMTGWKNCQEVLDREILSRRNFLGLSLTKRPIRLCQLTVWSQFFRPRMSRNILFG